MTMVLVFIFTPYINMIYPDACRQCGARINKYGHVQGGRENMNHDFCPIEIC